MSAGIENNDTKQMYFARKLTPEVLAELFPDHKFEKNDSSASRLQKVKEGAASASSGFSGFIHALLFSEKPKQTKNELKFPNLYGYFIVVKEDNKLRVFSSAVSAQYPKNAELYLVADLVGLPIARITGKHKPNSFSPVSGPGQSADGEYAIDLWLDPGNLAKDGTVSDEVSERIGRFIQHYLSNNNQLTIEDFCRHSETILHPLIDRMCEVPAPANAWQTGQALPSDNQQLQASLDELRSSALSHSGISTRIIFRPGSRIFRHQLTIDENILSSLNLLAAKNYVDWDDSSWKCNRCSTMNDFGSAFCYECGNPKPSGVKLASQRDATVNKILTKDGDELVFDLNFISYNQPSVNFDDIAAKCIEVLRPYCRKLTVENIDSESVIAGINGLLNTNLTTGENGPVGEFAVVDFKTVDSDWKIQTRALLKERLRSLDREYADIEMDEARFAFREAQLIRNRKDRGLVEKENAFQIEQLATDLKHDVNIERIAAANETEKRKIAAESQISADRIDRDVERSRRDLDKEDFSNQKRFARNDEVETLDHEISLERKVFEHDLTKQQALDAAQLKKSTAEIEVELSKAKSTQELEIERLRVEHELQREKLQAMASIDLAQRDQLKGMSAAQMLAMQATGLAEKGATDALAKLAASDADSREAAVKAEMLQKMLDMQSESSKASSEMQMKLMMASLEAQKEASSRVEKAHEKTAESAEKWNEKSIDAISKVTISASGKSRMNETDKSGASRKQCGACNGVLSDGAKFCIECGTKVP
jgi:hypothetical protein